MGLKNRATRMLLVFVLLAGLSGQAFAWNDRGHMTVAYIAYKQLTPVTRDRANALLKLNPKYGEWAATVQQQAPTASADDKNLMIFMIAATWADQIKRDAAYKQDGSQGGSHDRETRGSRHGSRESRRLLADARGPHARERL